MMRLESRIPGGLLGTLLAAALAAPGVLHAGGAAEELIARIASSPPAERPRLVHELARAGEAAIAPTRQARDGAADPGLKEAYARAATWQLALKAMPVLQAGAKDMLTFDGQYAGLGKEGPEVVPALFALAEDAATDGLVRLAALRAIADVAAPKRGAVKSAAADPAPPRGGSDPILSRLRKLHHDLLLPFFLKEEVRFLLAIFGDQDAVRSEITRYEKLARSKDPSESHASHRELAQLYYRMRDYGKAVKSYERVIGDLEGQLERLVRRQTPEVIAEWRRRIALECYNAACSASLNRDIDKAQEYLRRAIEIEPSHYVNMEKDGDLANLRKDPGYAEFRKGVAKMKDEL